MEELRRTKVDIFNIKDAIPIDMLKENIRLLDIETIFKDKKTIELNTQDLKLFLNGVQLKKQEKDRSL